MQTKKEKSPLNNDNKILFFWVKFCTTVAKKKSPAKGAKGCFGRNAQKLPYFEGKKSQKSPYFRQ